MSRITCRRARISLALILGVLMSPASGAGEELDWGSIGKKAPEELLEMAKTKEGSLFMVTSKPKKGEKPDGRYYMGFFISRDGLALCPLEPLCWKLPPIFRAAGSVNLKPPTVLTIFEEEGLALVNFDHKPEMALAFSEQSPPRGKWVSFVLPSFVQGGAIAGPILAHRRTSFFSKLKAQRKPIKNFSIAVPRPYGGEILEGTPVIDAKGEVVAVHSFALRMPLQTLVIARPTAGFSERVKAAVEGGARIKVPIPIADQPFDPVVYSEEYIAANIAVSKWDYATARRHAKAAVKKIPGKPLCETLGAYDGRRV